MNRLQEQPSGGYVRDVLKGLPIDPEEFYNEFYREAIERIKKPSNHFSRLAMNVLAWISRAQRPLKEVELRHALAVMPGQKYADEHKNYLTPMGPLVGCCAGLVEIDTQSVVRLTHPTVQEYLDKFSDELFSKADFNIARTCLTYLCFDAFSENPCVSDEGDKDDKDLKSRLQLFPFLDYAVPYWCHHLRGNPEKELKELTLSLLDNDSNLSNFKQVWNISRHLYRGYPPLFHPVMTGLHIAAYFDLEFIVSSLLAREDVDINSKDEYGRTPLWWAIVEGHDAVVKQLLARKDVDVNPKDSHDSRTPLWWAMVEGHDAVVKLLLARKDVGVNPRDEYGRTPLSWAMVEGHDSIIKQLLALEDIDLNLKDNYNSRTPLSWAAEKGYSATVKQLLAHKDIDVNLKDKYGRTALSWAARNGHDAVVKQLLAHKDVDVNLKDEDGQTPLSLAAEMGHHTVTQLLE